MTAATELMDVRDAQDGLPQAMAWNSAVMTRLEPLLRTRSRPLRVLDVGAAQGRAVIALSRLGHDAVGVDPSPEALETAVRLAELEEVECQVVAGTAENLPFEDSSFDVVLCSSVLEHVDDVDAALREAYRVLRPGGVYWFNSASSMCPIQNEISGMPLFGWYPLPLKRRLMAWARDHQPHRVGHTTRPAMHWFSERTARRRLAQAGFGHVVNRWQLRAPGEHSSPVATWFIAAAKRSSIARRIGDTLITGCAWAAVRPE